MVSVPLRTGEGLVPGRFQPWWLLHRAGYGRRL